MKKSMLRETSTSLYDVVYRLSHRVCPIYARDNYGNPFLVGTGVPVGMGSERFLVTAGHVLDELKDRSIITLGDSELIRFGLRSHQYGFAAGAIDADVGVIHVPPEVVKKIVGRFQFTSPAEVKRLEHNRENPNALRVYCLIGYPHSRNKRRPKSQYIFARAYYWLTTGLDEVDEQQWPGKRNTVHFAFPPLKKGGINLRGQNFNYPSPQGVSGGGIWALDLNRETGEVINPPTLVGIGIEFRPKDKAFVGTRIETAITLLVRLYDEVRSESEKTTHPAAHPPRTPSSSG